MNTSAKMKHADAQHSRIALSLAADNTVTEVSPSTDWAAVRENAPDTTVASPIDARNPKT